MSTLIIRPNGAGYETPFYKFGDTSNWKCVDEVSPDELTTYVYMDGPGTWYEVYALSDSLDLGRINWVKVWVRVYGYGYIRTVIRTGGGNYYGLSKSLTTTWSYHPTQYTTNPAGGDWTWTQINALQAGIELSPTVKTGADCTQVYVEIDYSPMSVLMVGEM